MREEYNNLDHGLLFEMARYGSPIAHGTLMVRSEVFDAFDYDEEMTCAQDYGLYLKVFYGSEFRCHVIPDVLYIRHHTEECVTETRREEQLVCASYARERYIHRNHLDISAVREMMERSKGRPGRHERMRRHAEAFWRSSGPRRVLRFMLVALYDPRYWLMEFRKARARGVGRWT